MREIWKAIKGWEGKYEISSFGRCRTVEHMVLKKDGVRQTIKGKLKTPHDNRHGYLAYSIGSKKRYYAHRLVAETFIPNPNGYAEIDHIDTDRKNNRVDNLRWTDRKGNCNNPITKAKMIDNYEKMKKPVVELDLLGNFIAKWNGASDIIQSKGYTSIFINRDNEKLRITGDRIYVALDFYDKDKSYTKIYDRRTRFLDNFINNRSVVELSDDNSVTNVFVSTIDASKQFGITRGSITLRCNNRKKGLQMRRPPLLMYFKDLDENAKRKALEFFISNSFQGHQKPS